MGFICDNTLSRDTYIPRYLKGETERGEAVKNGLHHGSTLSKITEMVLH